MDSAEILKSPAPERMQLVLEEVDCLKVEIDSLRGNLDLTATIPVAELAELGGLKVDAMRAKMKRERLPVVKIGKTWHVRKINWLNYLRAQEKAALAKAGG